MEKITTKKKHEKNRSVLLRSRPKMTTAKGQGQGQGGWGGVGKGWRHNISSGRGLKPNVQNHFGRVVDR